MTHSLVLIGNRIKSAAADAGNLGGAIVGQALHDITSKNKQTSLDALLWILYGDPWARTCLAAAGVDVDIHPRDWFLGLLQPAHQVTDAEIDQAVLAAVGRSGLVMRDIVEIVALHDSARVRAAVRRLVSAGKIGTKKSHNRVIYFARGGFAHE